MAEATLYATSGNTFAAGTFDAILKEFYLGPVQDQLNQEVFVIDTFEKAVVDWNGKHCIVPVHTSRNSSASAANGFVADNGNLPDAETQTYKSLNIKAKFQYGRFSVTGPAIAAAGKGSKNSFVSYVDAEMNALVDDVKNTANKTAISGGRVIGFLSSRATTGVNTGSTGYDAPAGTDATNDFHFDGDWDALAGVVNGTPSTWQRVQLYRMDTYAEIVSDPADTGAGNDNPGENATAIDIVITDASTAGSYGPTTGLIQMHAVGTHTGVSFSTIDVAAPYSIAVAIHDTVSSLDHANAVNTRGFQSDANVQPTGIFGNLADPVHFGQNRTDASGESSLQATIQTSDTGTTDGTRAALTVERMQGMMDEIKKASGDDVDMILCSPLQRQVYTGLIGQSIQSDASKATNGDGGFLSLSFAGVPIQASQDVSNGMMIFLNTSTWKLCELEPGGFADLDGNVLSRASGKDAYEGYYRWYWNLVCLKPGANGILTGIPLS